MEEEAENLLVRDRGYLSPSSRSYLCPLLSPPYTPSLSPVAATVAAVPLGLTALGFTGTGIAASSIAAKMMSAAAIANGGGVAAGSLVATLQSVGAAGLSMSSNVLLGSVGAAFGGWLGSLRKESPPSPPAGPNTEAEGGPQGGGDSPKPSPPNDKPSAPRK
ncbi:interferon alpha-inducible protein 27-like protein 2 [Tupaia chinensis]|nr:interferon alpha-inducible protein 27-like protein 2 [Tupaia chinensis]